MRYILAGTRLVLRTPRLWRYIAQPMLVAAIAFTVMGAAAYWLLVPRIELSLDRNLHATGTAQALLDVTTAALMVTVLVVASAFFYLTAVSFFSASLWEKLSREIEFMKTGRRVEARLTIPVILIDNLQRMLYALESRSFPSVPGGCASACPRFFWPATWACTTTPLPPFSGAGYPSSRSGVMFGSFLIGGASSSAPGS